MLDRDLSPTFVVLINSHAFAPFDAVEEPGCNDFGGRIFKAFDFVEKSVIDLLDERHNLGIDFGEVLNKTARIECPVHNDVDAVVVAVQILALVTLGKEWKVMS